MSAGHTEYGLQATRLETAGLFVRHSAAPTCCRRSRLLSASIEAVIRTAMILLVVHVTHVRDQ